MKVPEGSISRGKKKNNQRAFIQTFLDFLESLILAQSERWRRGLGMQVERYLFFKTVSVRGWSRKIFIAADW